ncbi:MAG: hypothetical protein RI580_13115 [Halothece sp. Uz-M2-17]|nr:hypothetical protein [Halothece sp. Uz-M2-17]
MISINNLPENYTIEAKEMNNLRGGIGVAAAGLIIVGGIFVAGAVDGFLEEANGES